MYASCTFSPDNIPCPIAVFRHHNYASRLGFFPIGAAVYKPRLPTKYSRRIGFRYWRRSLFFKIVDEICSPLKESLLTLQFPFQDCRWNMLLAYGFLIDAAVSFLRLPMKYDSRLGCGYWTSTFMFKYGSEICFPSKVSLLTLQFPFQDCRWNVFLA